MNEHNQTNNPISANHPYPSVAMETPMSCQQTQLSFKQPVFQRRGQTLCGTNSMQGHELHYPEAQVNTVATFIDKN